MKSTKFSSLLQKKNLRAGSTLIEALVAMLIVGLVLTGIATLLTYSIKNNAQADYRQIASSIAQDGIEFFRQQRSVHGWTNFAGATALNTTYCLPAAENSVIGMTVQSGTNCNNNVVHTSPPVNFTRTVTRNNVSGVVSITVTVSWSDGANTRDVQVRQDFYDF